MVEDIILFFFLFFFFKLLLGVPTLAQLNISADTMISEFYK
jgi:hypothetical protein